MEAEQAAYAQLLGRCKELATEYDRVQAELAARADSEQQARCRSALAFVHSRRAGPRSSTPGGRRDEGRASHKGTDLFAAWKPADVRVTSGRVSLGSSGLGGNTIWLLANMGPPTTTPTTSPIQRRVRVVGWLRARRSASTATVDNPRGGSPHLHFEILIRVDGGSSAVNPHETPRRGHAGSLLPAS